MRLLSKFGFLMLGVFIGAVGWPLLNAENPRFFNVLTVIYYIAIVATFIVLYRQLLIMKKQSSFTEEDRRGKNFFALTNFLQNEGLRNAREHVRKFLKEKQFENWGEVDKKHASMVCSSYDTACIVYREKFIDQKIFRNNYGPDIWRCFEILSKFIKSEQLNKDKTYWDDFQTIGLLFYPENQQNEVDS